MVWGRGHSEYYSAVHITITNHSCSKLALFNMSWQMLKVLLCCFLSIVSIDMIRAFKWATFHHHSSRSCKTVTCQIWKSKKDSTPNGLEPYFTVPTIWESTGPLLCSKLALFKTSWQMLEILPQVSPLFSSLLYLRAFQWGAEWSYF